MESSTSKCKDGQIMVLEHEHPLELVDLQRKRQHSEETDDDDIDLDTIPEFRGQCGRCGHVISEYHMYYYKCVDTCDYSLHKFCAELPPKLKHTAHVHPLVIRKYIYRSSTWLGKKTKNYIDAQHPNLLHLPFTDQNHSLQKHMFSREFGSESSTRTHEGDLEHIIHQHPLILVDAQSKQMTMSTSSDIKPLPCHDPMKKIELLCNACVRPIMDVPYYMCSNEDQHCNFAIHEWCTRLPTKLDNHPIHQNHEFVLLKNVSHEYFSVFSCDFDMHIECALLLPKTVRHRYDKKHAFNISYFPVENHAADYFCDICESSLDPTDRFFYHCNDCDQSMHLACAPMMFHWETPFRYSHGDVNKYINIKFRGTHSIKDHPHLLSFVQGLASDGDCEMCKRALQYKLIFKCSQCKFAIHYKCCKFAIHYKKLSSS
ncbi:putative DC1, C1-like protein [Tanacetum coccineum]